MKNRYSIYVAVLIILSISSCKKQQTESIVSAEDNSAIESEYAQIFDVVTDYVSNNTKTGKTDDLILPSGALVTFEDTSFTDGDGVAFTIDYGPLEHGGSFKGIQCKDGLYRSGKMKIGLSQRWITPGSITTVAISTADAYYVGNGSSMYMLSGVKKITRNSDQVYTVEVENAALQRYNGKMTWEATRTVTKKLDTNLGEIYEITGTANGTNKNNDAFSVEIVTPLKKKISLNCFTTFVAGKLLLTNSDAKQLEINYDSFGNEKCDNTITVTYNGKSREIQVW